MTKLATEDADEPTAILLLYELHIQLAPYYQWHYSFFEIVCAVHNPSKREKKDHRMSTYKFVKNEIQSGDALVHYS